MERKKTNRFQKISPSGIALIGAMLFLLSFFFLFNHYICEKRAYAFTYINHTLYEQQAMNIVENPKEAASSPATGEDAIPNTYIGMLEIPKLAFQRGFLDKRASGNNIEENITILKESNAPNEEGGNFILAGHSGTGEIAFFNELYRLEIGDLAKVTYLGETYTYQLVRSYQVSKTGTVPIYRDQDKTTLTLITCTNHDQYTQTIYIFTRV